MGLLYHIVFFCYFCKWYTFCFKMLSLQYAEFNAVRIFSNMGRHLNQTQCCITVPSVSNVGPKSVHHVNVLVSVYTFK